MSGTSRAGGGAGRRHGLDACDPPNGVVWAVTILNLPLKGKSRRLARHVPDRRVRPARRRVGQDAARLRRARACSGRSGSTRRPATATTRRRSCPSCGGSSPSATWASPLAEIAGLVAGGDGPAGRARAAPARARARARGRSIGASRPSTSRRVAGLAGAGPAMSSLRPVAGGAGRDVHAWTRRPRTTSDAAFYELEAYVRDHGRRAPVGHPGAIAATSRGTPAAEVFVPLNRPLAAEPAGSAAAVSRPSGRRRSSTAARTTGLTDARAPSSDGSRRPAWSWPGRSACSTSSSGPSRSCGCRAATSSTATPTS